MGFSLVQKLKQAGNDVSQFAGQVTGHSAPPPATLPKLGSAQPSLLNRAGSIYSRDIMHPVAGAMHTVGNVTDAIGRDVVQPAIHSAPYKAIASHVAAPTYNYLANGGIVGQHNKGYATFSRSLTHGMERSLVGTGQAASGLYDLAGGQHGTNRTDKFFDHAGKSIDTTSKQQHDNSLVYHGSQLAGDALQLAVGGGELKAGAKVAGELPKIGGVFKAAGKGTALADKPAQAIRDATKGGNIAQRVAGRAAGNIVSPAYQAANVAFTAGQEGKNASHGQKVAWHLPSQHITGSEIPGVKNVPGLRNVGFNMPQGVVPDLLTGGVALPAGGAVAHEALPLVKAGAEQTAKGVKAAAKHEIVATAKVNDKLAVNADKATQISQLQKEVAGHHQDINQLDLATHKGQLAHEQYQRKIDQKMGQIKDLKSQIVPLSRMEQVRANGVGLSVGGPNALSYQRALKEGKTFTGPDGKPRFEIDDSKATAAMPKQSIIDKYWKADKPFTMGNFLDHPRLYQDYPQLADVTVKGRDFANPNMYGGYHAPSNTVYVSRDLMGNNRLDDLRETLLHEGQHAIQNIEGFAGGTNSIKAGGYENYRNNLGEMEAHLVGDRANMSPLERKYDPIASHYQQGPAPAGPQAAMSAYERRPAANPDPQHNLSPDDPNYWLVHGPEAAAKPKPADKLSADNYAETFGVSKEQATKEIKTSKQASKRQTTKQPPASKPKATAAENTAKNPLKVDIPKVEVGNYEQARINPQLASHPVNIAAEQAMHAAKQTGLSTSEFGKMVEGTTKPRNAADRAAVDAYRHLADRTHATSQALGGNTPYVQNYFRHEWDLSDPEKAAQFAELAQKSGTVDPYAFKGLDYQPRVFKTIAEGEKAGFSLKNQKVTDEIKQYGSGSAYALKQQALAKGLVEADMSEASKPHTFDLGSGDSLPLSAKGMQQAKGYSKNMASDNKLLKGYRTGNRGFKQILLSVSQFHPVNISLLRAAPTLTMEGHPVRAAKGLFDTFAAQAAPHYSAKLQASALRDGTIEASARLGTPIKFGSDYATEGKIGFGKGGLGEKAIFERAMPAMHIQMVKSAMEDIKEKGLSLDSKEAHALGTRINEIMGFVNQEVRNLDKGTQRRLGDIFLAPQFTRSKWATNKSAVTEGGLAGSYARRAIVANSAAAALVSLGVGYALSQKSDNLNDILLRSVFHPSVPTPLKDKKGNTMELGLPATQSSEVLGLLGFNLKRVQNGHLSVSWKGGNIPGNVANYGRSRLAVLPATGLKVATNTDYAGKPLYDPAASAKDKATQAGTTVTGGLLPIGGQGALQTNFVKSKLPAASQAVLNANQPGTNPVIKSLGSSIGLTPRTDKTVGKGQQTTQYFDAMKEAGKGLNAQEQAALTMVTGSKKNPVTGAYDVKPDSDDNRAKATALLQNPRVIDRLQAMNKQLQKEGQPVDPLFLQSKDNITKFYQYQAMPPGSADRKDWMNKNSSWYTPLSTARTDFFNSIPAGDPNKPKAPIQYPTAPPAVAAVQDQYDTLTDGASKGDFIQSHPELLDQWKKQADYTNAMRTAQGYAAFKDSPQAAPQLQTFMDRYSAADKAGRKAIRTNSPDDYQKMIAYYDAVSLSGINKEGAVNQLQGEPDTTDKQNKAIQSVAKDIYQNADGTYALAPAGWMQGLKNGSSGSSTGTGKGKTANYSLYSKTKGKSYDKSMLALLKKAHLA